MWFADPVNGGCVRVAEGGELLDEVATDDLAFACMLGGPDGRHLFMLTSTASNPAETHVRSGRVQVVEVAVPHAGLP